MSLEERIASLEYRFDKLTEVLIETNQLLMSAQHAKTITPEADGYAEPSPETPPAPPQQEVATETPEAPPAPPQQEVAPPAPPQPETVAAPPAPSMTAEELNTAIVVEFQRLGGREKIDAEIQKFGVTGISELPADKYQELLDNVKRLV